MMSSRRSCARCNPHVAEHSTEYSVMRRVFYAGCTTIFHSFFMSNELAALSHDDRSKAFKNVQAQIKEISKREDFYI